MTSTTSSASAVEGADPAPAPRLTCYFKTRNENDVDVGKETTSGKAILCQETGKKSSFLLQQKQAQSLNNADVKDGADWYLVPKPAHLCVKHDKLPTASTTEPNEEATFFFGGLQLVFDAKNIEIYLTSPEGKESYLMTCKGIPYKMNSGKENVSQESESIQKVEWRRALCVVPGGPRCISCLRIKLIGGSASTASDSTSTKVQFLKLTARIVDNSSPSLRTPALKSPIAATNNPQGAKTKLPTFNPNMFGPATNSMNAASHSEPPVTQKDLGAAMAGLSFMARKTEENMANLFKQQSKKIEDQLESYLTKMELQMRALKPTLAMQHQLIKENQIIMKEQQQIMDSQASQISKLVSDNQDLQVRVQSLQADISILRSQATYSNVGQATLCSNDANIDANIDVDIDAGVVSESKLSPKQQSLSEELQLDAYNPPSADLAIAERNNIEIENAHLRNVLKNVARGIDGEPLFGGCGATESTDYSRNANLGIDESNIELENIRLKNAIRNISQGIDEEPLLKGCGATPVQMYPEALENAEMDAGSRAIVPKAAREIDAVPLDSGCGNVLQKIEDDLVRAIASRMKPANISLDATRSIKNIQKKYSDEMYGHTPNIEVELMQEGPVMQKIDEGNESAHTKIVDDETKSKDGKSTDN